MSGPWTSNQSGLSAMMNKRNELKRKYPHWSDEVINEVMNESQSIPDCHSSFGNVQQRLTKRSLDAIADVDEQNIFDNASAMFDTHIGASSVPLDRTCSRQAPYMGQRSSSAMMNNQSNSNRRIANMPCQQNITFGVSGSQPPFPTATHAQSFGYAKCYDPAEFLKSLSSGSTDLGVTQIPGRQRCVSSFHEPMGSASYSHNSSLQTISPVTSASSYLQPGSVFTDSMTRQSSMTDNSMIGALEMMRVESFHSNFSEFPSPCVNSHDLFLSETIDVGDLKTGANRSPEELDRDLRGCGYTLVDRRVPSSIPRFSARDGGLQNAHETVLPAESAPDMQRNESSQSSTSTSSSGSKATERRLKHLQNARQMIMPKECFGRARSSSAPNANLDLHTRLSSASDGQTQTGKKVISKALRYNRAPQTKSKIKCDQCNEYPAGFRGEHELRRHKDRAHAAEKKVWVCAEPAEHGEYSPKAPLKNCKACKIGKKYYVYYNAAAHLRRAHFDPCRRGRKPKGQEGERRGGKAGGKWPPIDWLRDQGWIKQITIREDRENLSRTPSQVSTVLPIKFEEDWSSLDEHFTTKHFSDQQTVMPDDSSADSSLDAQGLNPSHFGDDGLHADILGLQTQNATFDYGLGYPSPVEPRSSTQFLQAPKMAHTVSAPPNFFSGSMYGNPMFYGSSNDFFQSGANMS